MPPENSHRAGSRLRVLLGAAFLMATSAIGPGFLTQTAVFTQALGASFGFAILVSVLFDLGAQLNIWRVIVASRLPAQPLLDRVVPNLGKFIAVLVAAGGLAFNIGNVAGAGLGLNALLGLDPRLLLLDEPTAGMALEEVPAIVALIAEIQREGTRTILLVEHKIDMVMALSDSIAVLQDGRLIADDTPERVSRDPAVQAAYFGGARRAG